MSATMVYMIRGAGVGSQTTPGTAATIGTNGWMNWCTGITITDQINYESPQVLAYSIWLQRQGIALTRMCQWTVNFLIDTWQWGWFLKSFDGAPDTGVFTPGLRAGKMLTIAKVNKNLTLWDRAMDAVCSQIQLTYSVSGLMTGQAQGVGVADMDLATPPTPAYPDIDDKSPVRNNWPVAAINGAATGVQDMSITFRQTADPYFESPLVDPTSTTPAGVAPAAWEIEDMGADFSVTRKYVPGSSSGLYALRHNIDLDVNSLHAYDPYTVGAPGWEISMPKLVSNSGSDDDSRALARETFGGFVAYDGTLGSGGEVTFVGGGAYADS
jgi:hypothetical protein